MERLQLFIKEHKWLTGSIAAIFVSLPLWFLTNFFGGTVQEMGAGFKDTAVGYFETVAGISDLRQQASALNQRIDILQKENEALQQQHAAEMAQAAEILDAAMQAGNQTNSLGRNIDNGYQTLPGHSVKMCVEVATEWLESLKATTDQANPKISSIWFTTTDGLSFQLRCIGANHAFDSHILVSSHMQNADRTEELLNNLAQFTEPITAAGIRTFSREFVAHAARQLAIQRHFS